MCESGGKSKYIIRTTKKKKKEKMKHSLARENERERYWIVDRIVFYSSSPCFNSLRKSTLSFSSSSLNSFFSVALSAVTLNAGSSFLAAILVKRDPTLDTFFN